MVGAEGKTIFAVIGWLDLGESGRFWFIFITELTGKQLNSIVL